MDLTGRWVLGGSGVATALLGLLLLIRPDWGATVFYTVLGAYLALMGTVNLWDGLRRRRHPSRNRLLLGGALMGQRNLMALKQPFTVLPAAAGVGTAGGRVARLAVAHDGNGAVGRGAFFEPQRLPYHEEVGQHDERGVAPRSRAGRSAAGGPGCIVRWASAGGPATRRRGAGMSAGPVAEVALELVGAGFVPAAGRHAQDGAEDGLGALGALPQDEGPLGRARQPVGHGTDLLRGVAKTGREGEPPVRSGRVVQTWVVRGTSAR
ncbi:MAG: DUF308 domain-containing protein [Caldilineaceae bacterium]|nr:DUF308 domain-containing protein [Caldilineaceae bacterium]